MNDTTTATRSGFAGDPAATSTATGSGGCCGNPPAVPAPAVAAPAVPGPAEAASPCCGTTADAQAAGSCCGTSARAGAVAAGVGCCG